VTERFLAIETSSPRLSLAAGTDSKLLATFQGPLAWRHAETLFSGLQSLLRKVRWRPDSLTGVAVSVGPGSFTGIRIGLAAARAWGQALGIRVVGVNALQTLAWPLAARGARWIAPVIDALRGQVFAALYEAAPSGALKTRMPGRHLPLLQWEKEIRALVPARAAVSVAGDGVRLLAPRLSFRTEKAPEKDWYPRADALLALARPRLAKAGPGSYRRVLPLYLRQAAVQERRKP
jgi:tRNA threonylcarbamoyladenosine biosynthesis protein TsaB